MKRKMEKKIKGTSQSVIVAECVKNADDDEEMIEILLVISMLNEGADNEEPLLADPVMHGKLQENGRVHAEHFDNILCSFIEKTTVSNIVTTTRKQESMTSNTFPKRERYVQKKDTCCTMIKEDEHNCKGIDAEKTNKPVTCNQLVIQPAQKAHVKYEDKTI